MTILRKNQTKKRVIDLTGPDGNAYVLLGISQGLCKRMGIDYGPIREEMIASDYENLVQTFDKYFGSVVDLMR